MTAATLTRRGALCALATAASAPAIAFQALPIDAACIHWAERQFHVDRLARLVAAYDEAEARLPAWAQSGPERIDTDGNLCGAIVGWPQIEKPEPARVGERIIRPSISQAREHFEFSVRVFSSSKSRANCRVTMRRSIRAIIVRLRERKRLCDELGLTAIDREISYSVTVICRAEDAIARQEPSPNAVAAGVMASLCADCCNTSTAAGPEYCGTMAMGLMALRSLLPSLSGLIREHAVFFVEHPDLPLVAMPFTSR
jgi:hypothetical protein